MDVSTKIALAATFAALSSALGTILTIFRLRKSEQANFFLQMTDRYNTEEMQDALSEIVTWYKTDPINFIAEWKNLFEQNAPDGVRLDANRRRVTRFFENIAQLYIGGYIDKKLAALISNYSGLNIYYQVIVPMNDSVFGPNAEGLPDILKTIRPKHGTGVIR